MYSNSASLNIESASEPSWLFGSELCWSPNLKFQLFFGSHSATVPQPLLPRPRNGVTDEVLSPCGATDAHAGLLMSALGAEPRLAHAQLVVTQARRLAVHEAEG